MSTNPITDLKALLRKDGSHWIKKNFSRKQADGHYGYCLMGGLRVLPRTWDWDLSDLDKARDLLAMVIREQYPTLFKEFYLSEGHTVPEDYSPIEADYIITFNDYYKIEWSDVEKMLDKTELKWEEEYGE